MKIAITGAFSYSGQYIARRLLARGEEVITLTGHPNRPDPFGGRIRAYALDFGNPSGLIQTLRGADVLVNTYWVRFDYKENTFSQAVENTRTLIGAAQAAGVRRVVHISITNPSLASPLPYFRGKAINEKTVMESGLSYAILRPTVLFGKGDILINNIAFLLRRFPLFFMPGDGNYRLQPICVEDLADLVVESIYRRENSIADAVGPDLFPFREMVALIGRKIGARRPLISVPPRLTLAAARGLGLLLGDVLLTPEEVQGLMAELLVSGEPPRGTTHLADWLEANREAVGRAYASEIGRHYR